MFPNGYFAVRYFDEAYFSPHGPTIVATVGGSMSMLGVGD